MNIKEAEARIRGRVWEAIAKGMGEGIDREKLDQLVDITTEAALQELDHLFEDSVEKEIQEELVGTGEQLVWQGRPFLSIRTYYIVTSERLRIVEGLFAKKRQDVELVRIQDVEQTQTIGERLLFLGDIIVHSHDRGDMSHLTLQNVTEPERVHELLRGAIVAARKRHGLSYREEM